MSDLSVDEVGFGNPVPDLLPVVLPFGKYANQPITKVPSSYLKWVVKNINSGKSLIVAACFKELFDRRVLMWTSLTSNGEIEVGGKMCKVPQVLSAGVTASTGGPFWPDVSSSVQLEEPSFTTLELRKKIMAMVKGLDVQEFVCLTDDVRALLGTEYSTELEILEGHSELQLQITPSRVYSVWKECKECGGFQVDLSKHTLGDFLFARQILYWGTYIGNLTKFRLPVHGVKYTVCVKLLDVSYLVVFVVKGVTRIIISLDKRNSDESS